MKKSIIVAGFGPGISTAVAERFGREGTYKTYDDNGAVLKTAMQNISYFPGTFEQLAAAAKTQ